MAGAWHWLRGEGEGERVEEEEEENGGKREGGQAGRQLKWEVAVLKYDVWIP